MENKEFETVEASNKKNKNSGFVIGAVVGAVIATAAILVVLFATGVIGAKDDESNLNTAANTENIKASDTVSNTDSTAGTDAAKSDTQPSATKKYREVTVENMSVYTKDSGTKTETITLQIPYMKEFEELGLDLDSLEIGTEESEIVNEGDFTWAYIYASDGTQSIPLICITYRGKNLTYDNILMVYFDLWFDDLETGVHKGCDGRYMGVDEIVWKYSSTDYKNHIGYGFTKSGYKEQNGVYYDNNGNIITDSEYWEEVDRLDDEALASVLPNDYY